MRNKILNQLGIMATVALLLASCTKDLDRQPKYGNTAASLYVNLAGYKSVLAKTYAGLTLTGNSGPDGQGDIAGIDEGFSSYIRQYWSAQELSTDEAVIGWNDATIKDFHNLSWSSADVFIRALYSRIYFQITLCNEFIRESTPAKLSERGIGGADATEIGYMNAEARFLRALSYYHALDLQNILRSFNKYEYLEKNFFLNMLNQLAVNLAAAGKMKDAEIIAGKFSTDRTRIQGYLSMAETVFRQDADPYAFVFLDSAYALSRKIDYAFNVAEIDPRYLQIQLLSEIGSRDINNQAAAILRDLPEQGKFWGVFLRSTGLAYEGNYYMALTAIPNTLTESQDLQCRTAILVEACKAKEIGHKHSGMFYSTKILGKITLTRYFYSFSFV